MCGLAGILSLSGSASERAQTERAEIVRRMTATMIHRGPDGEGYVSRPGCALGFRRLAIVDLAAASPPFANEDRSIWSVCNGEIYNAPALFDSLRARDHRLETGVDTEVIPHLYEEFGSDLVDHLNGMFAFALWDERRSVLLLGRDRAGEKPLFYWQDDEELVFASELRALVAHPRVRCEIDPAALQRFLLHGYFPAPCSPLARVRKLGAGELMEVRDGLPTIRRYWDLADYFPTGPGDRRDPDQIAEELDGRIGLAVERRRRSDVPVGLYLSSGLDSSTLLAHMAEQIGPGVPVFALGHEDPSFDETNLARETARHFDAEFHELVLGEADLATGLQQVVEGFDEPLGDASTIPTLLLSRFAVERVKVVLSGEGADELFAGYPTYIGHKVAQWLSPVPSFLRRSLLLGAARAVPVSMGNVGLDYLLERFAVASDLEPIERHHIWFGTLEPHRHREVLSPEVLAALGSESPLASAHQILDGRRLPDTLSRVLYSDFSLYLPDDLLTKVDRATMLASLEARAPFLDHELAEFVAGLPSNLKLQRLTTKAIMRRAAARRLPAEVLGRRKRGFNIPFSRWLLHGLGQQMLERFSPERTQARGLFSSAGVTALIEEHLERRADHRKPLFALLVFDLWCDRLFGESSTAPIAMTDAGESLEPVAAMKAVS